MVTAKPPHYSTRYIMTIDGDEAPSVINLVPTLTRFIWTHGVHVGTTRDYKSHPYTRWMGSAMILPSFMHDTTGVGVRFIIPHAHHVYVAGTNDDGRIHADQSSDAINLVPTVIGGIWYDQDHLYSTMEELYCGGGMYAPHL